MYTVYLITLSILFGVSEDILQWKGATKPGRENWSSERADQNLLRQIISRAFNRAVVDVKQLNKHYDAFSSETYGETSFDRMNMIIEKLNMKDRDIFVDLGSGVGQVSYRHSFCSVY